MTYIPGQNSSDGIAKIVYEGKTSGVKETFTALDFLARLVTHIPAKGEQMVRYYGYYSNKSRGMRKKNDDACSGTVIVESDVKGKDSTRTGCALYRKFIMLILSCALNAGVKCGLFHSSRMTLQ